MQRTTKITTTVIISEHDLLTECGLPKKAAIASIEPVRYHPDGPIRSIKITIEHPWQHRFAKRVPRKWHR